MVHVCINVSDSREKLHLQLNHTDVRL